MATSPRPEGAHYDNVGPHKTLLSNPTAGLPEVHYDQVMVLSNAAGAGMPSVAPVLGSNHQLLSLVNDKALTGGSVCVSGDHLQVPEKAACTNMIGGMPVALAPMTPAKDKQVYGFIQHEMSQVNQDDLIHKGSMKKAHTRQGCVNVLLDSSQLVAPITPDKSKALENNHEMIQSTGIGLNRDGNVQEGSQSSGDSLLIEGASLMKQRIEIHTPFSSHFSQPVERINIERNLRTKKTKAATRKKHRPKVLKDLPFGPKEPVIPKPVTPKQVKRKQNQSRSNVPKKNSNCSNAPQEMTRDTSKTSRIARKSSNQHSDNGTRRRLDFSSENQSVDEHPKDAFIGSPIHYSRRELLKKNWKHLARMAGKANSTYKTHIVEVSKQNNIQSHVKLDGDTEMTLVQGEMENEQAKSCYNHVDNARRGCIYPISSNKAFMQTHASNIPQFPPECKRRRTMLMHNGRFGKMKRISKSCSFVDEQNLVTLGDLRTSDFILTSDLIKRVTKKRSKVPIRAPKPVLTEIVAGNKELLQNLESRHQECVEALFTDTRMRIKTGKRTKRKHVHLHSTSDQCTDMSQAIVPYMYPTYNYNAAEGQSALVSYESNMIVPYAGSYETKRKRLKAKVDLDDETKRVWNLLMGKMIRYEGSDPDREEQWEEQRTVFGARADSFIARMRLIQGDRQFSPWKGSVLDSVIGVFLTQNVSDHLSSSAFMALAAKFPLKPRKDNLEQNANRMSIFTDEHDIITSSNMLCQHNPLGHNVFEPDSFIYYIGDEEGNKMHRPDEPGRVNTGYHDLENSCTDVNAQRRRPEGRSFTSDDKTEISTTVRTGLHFEDKRILNEAVSSLNFSPSDSISSSLFPSTTYAGLSLPTLVNTDPRTVLDSYSLSQEPIDISGVSITHGVHNLNDGMMSLNKPSTVDDQNSENLTSFGRLKIVEDACQETSSKASSLLNCSQLDSMGLLPDLTSDSSDSVNMKNVDSRQSKSISRFILSDPTKFNKDTVTAQRNCNESSKNSTEPLSQQSSATMSNVTISHDTRSSIGKLHFRSLASLYGEEDAMISKQSESKDCEVEKNQYEVGISSQKQLHLLQGAISNSCNDLKRSFQLMDIVEPNSKVEVCSPIKVPSEASKGAPKAKNTREESAKKTSFDWDSLRREACHNGYNSERSKDRMDSLDWEAVMRSNIGEISETIKERGMNNVLAGRIKDFLNRLVTDHGSLDLEWLRDVPPEKTKDYLLSIRGLGLKSVECVRLLTLHQHAFPVDTNVGRICVRLGWVPLKPLPESLQLHLLESYPVLETIQKYLWPRLCKLDQRTLYELHYQMITFGKVFCTKGKPNCNACPMRGECRHFASAWTSSRLLQGPEERELVKSTMSVALENHDIKLLNAVSLCQNEENYLLQGTRHNDDPIIEEPPSPELQCQVAFESEIEETYYEDPCEIPTINLNLGEFTQNLQNYIQENVELSDGEIEKAIVAITSESASIPMPKLKNVKRLRTEHLVYELPDGHPLLEGLEKREIDDPCPYLLSIWAPGETVHSIEPPQTCCNHQETGRICQDMTCFSCSCRREEQSQTIRGTLLIPCRTANRGSFPLNGTYFQVNEVFADHESSHNPLIIPRRLIWNLRRRIVYFGTSIPTLFRGLSMEEIQLCFSRGFVCLRGFDQKVRAPRPLSPRLHLAASHAQKDKKSTHKNEKNAATGAADKI
ncbi:DNA glycosylase/AP lyase ROS1-like [Zingiber officinale]|uniref:DNA glycosylase/AP lyase ROS1-like n=1 Tax=Zingiber officinale TaxID=94328 RepID=UPI001C4B9346|nr:DNA glycosylase/AP lyase ROS1-like [Zingiber officinale]